MIFQLNLHCLHSNIRVDSQEPILFATTIAENIRYVEDVSEEEMIAAPEAANAHSFISELPDGYNTLAGELGTQLSEGQKRRIVIARALVRDTGILLLDDQETTLALDAESESLVQAALDKVYMLCVLFSLPIIYYTGYSIVMIVPLSSYPAHRLSRSRHYCSNLIKIAENVKRDIYFDLVSAQVNMYSIILVFTDLCIFHLLVKLVKCQVMKKSCLVRLMELYIDCKSNDVRSLFSLVRGSFYCLGAKLCYVEGDETNLRLMIGDKLIQGTESRQSSPLLRGRFHQKQLDSLRAAVDQEKSFHSVAKHPSSSEWIGNGKYMSFADYRFVIKGRLNQLPVRTVLKRTKQLKGSIHCRHCRSQPETLAHALNHCRGYMGLIRSRHGEILKRIRKAVPSELGDVYLE